MRDGCCVLSELQWCWRNVLLEGEAVNAWELDPVTFQLPRYGMLQLDFCSFRPLPGSARAAGTSQVCPNP